MAWAALGKAAMGAVKGKAKQIATDKLLNRKKKTDARRASAQKMMGQDSGAGEEKGGAIVKAQISPMPLATSTEAIGKTPAAGARVHPLYHACSAAQPRGAFLRRAHANLGNGACST